MGVFFIVDEFDVSMKALVILENSNFIFRKSFEKVPF